MRTRPGTLLFLLLIPALTAASGEGEFWGLGGVEGSLYKGFRIKVEEKVKLGDDFSLFYHHWSDAGVSFKARPWLGLSLNYRQMFEKKAGVWRQERRPHVSATVNWKLAMLGFSELNKLEYRNMEACDDMFRYRNKLLMLFPALPALKSITPFIGDEIFVPLNENGLNENRVFAGLTTSVLDKIKLDFFYFWKKFKTEEAWVPFHVLNLEMRLVFK